MSRETHAATVRSPTAEATRSRSCLEPRASPIREANEAAAGMDVIVSTGPAASRAAEAGLTDDHVSTPSQARRLRYYDPTVGADVPPKPFADATRRCRPELVRSLACNPI